MDSSRPRSSCCRRRRFFSIIRCLKGKIQHAYNIQMMIRLAVAMIRLKVEEGISMPMSVRSAFVDVEIINWFDSDKLFAVGGDV